MIPGVSFPRVTVEEALRIPQVIKDKNGGNAWSTDQVAEALELSRKNPKFFYIAAASRDFGLTLGSRDTERIELAPLGREIVYAPSREQEQLKKREAFPRVDLFKRVLEYYRGSSLPEMKYLGNTLKAEFGLPDNKHEEFSRLFRENCAYLGIPSGFVSNASEKPTDQLIQVVMRVASIQYTLSLVTPSWEWQSSAHGSPNSGRFPGRVVSRAKSRN
jgi:hypothetical protein